MDIRSVVFEVNGTLVRIITEDDMDQIFWSAAHFLTYQGIDLCREQVRDLYFRIMKEQQRAMFDSDQGTKAYRDCVPDYTITDFRDLLNILALP